MSAGAGELGARTDVGAWQRTSPVAIVFYVLRFLRRLVTDGLPALAPLAAAFAASERLLWSWLGAALGVGAIGLVAWSVLSWLRFRFRLADGLVQIQRGVVLREQLSVDFDRVQNVNIREPAYMRPFGLATLAIDTAGSAEKAVDVAGVRRRLAVDLRRSMLARAEETASPGPGPDAGDASAAAGPVDAAEEGELVLRRSTGDVAIYGLTASTLLWLFVFIGFLFSSADSLGEAWGEMLTDSIARAVRAGAGFGLGEVLMIVVLFLAVILLLPLLSMAGAIFRHYDYRLTFDGETFRRFSGLLSRHDESVKQHKIQEVVWVRNAAARLLGRVNVKLGVAQAGQAAQAAQSGVPMPAASFLVPSLRPAEATDVTARFFPGCDAGSVRFSRVDGRRYVSRYLLLGWTVPLVGIATGPTIAVHPAFALLLPAGYAFGALILYQAWRRLGYAVVGEYGFVRTGFIGATVNVFPLYKLQRVDLRQTPGQRRIGRAHLTLHLASGSHVLPYVRIEDAERLRDLALYHAEADPRPWY